MRFSFRGILKSRRYRRTIPHFLSRDMTPLRAYFLRKFTAAYSAAHGMKAADWPPLLEKGMLAYPGTIYDHRTDGHAIIEMEQVWIGADTFIETQLMALPKKIPVQVKSKRRLAVSMTLACATFYKEHELLDKLIAANDDYPIGPVQSSGTA